MNPQVFLLFSPLQIDLVQEMHHSLINARFIGLFHLN